MEPGSYEPVTEEFRAAARRTRCAAVVGFHMVNVGKNPYDQRGKPAGANGELVVRKQEIMEVR
jgi:uncharacterized protein (DUF849 family)